MNLLEIMNIRPESCEKMRRNELESQQTIQGLQNTISKCKMLLQRKEEQRERLVWKIESERSSYWYLNGRLRETEEELDREWKRSARDKFREKHYIFRKKYRIPNYSRQSLWERIQGKVLFTLEIIGIAVFGWALGI